MLKYGRDMPKLESKKHQFVSTKTAAEYCGISAATLKRWRYEGTGPKYYKPAGRVLYDIVDLCEFVQAAIHVPSSSRTAELAHKTREQA